MPRHDEQDWQERIAALRRRERRARERGIDPGQVQAMLDQRAEARKAKDWARADQIRDRLKEMGVEVMDTAEGTSWKVTD